MSNHPGYTEESVDQLIGAVEDIMFVLEGARHNSLTDGFDALVVAIESADTARKQVEAQEDTDNG